jgi:NTP pyrophosphatase (non-canonical NTP hydrolase)
LNYTIMKLGGEVGELQNKFGKVLRGDQGALQKFCDNAPKELGDVLWYVSETCYQLGLALDRVAADNLAKLAARQVAGTLKGSGDDR